MNAETFKSGFISFMILNTRKFFEKVIPTF